MEEENFEEKVYPNATRFNSFDEYYDSFLTARNNCDKRGYHRVDLEPAEDNSCMVCYDCDLWFDKSFAKSCGIEYKVEKI